MMRKLINLCKKEQRNLSVQFKDILKVDACEDDHEYRKIAISVFDHWLSKEEALTLLNDVSEEEQTRRNNLHYAFNKKLFDKTMCFTYRVKGRGKKTYPIFKNFQDKRTAYSYIKPNSGGVRSKFLYKLVLPQFDALYYEGWDDTCYLYYKNEDLLNSLIEWVKESGLHILPSD